MISTSQALQEALESTANKPHMIVMDNGREFTGKAFKDVLDKFGIKSWHTQPYTPCQNGKIERSWKTIFKSKVEGVPIEEQLEFLFKRYNEMWLNRLLSVLYGKNTCPKQAWDINQKIIFAEDYYEK
ncbi:ribonuclease H-like family [Trichomonas vaginalis G3]|uniref:ribonuclease H-like family n=1 Tax=Trichomonas vaginalis (strain ATCC PRA-98 / G3) TaxID=412133 RepID=UPI0021E59F29|nr:ribonuclease H-like family [Trichomonas vaginalis G3]KAI5545355.1 ribonuclease H-like family [Trichomonas vaginalis G3]